jgi:hypothetical protein
MSQVLVLKFFLVFFLILFFFLRHFSHFRLTNKQKERKFFVRWVNEISLDFEGQMGKLAGIVVLELLS